MQWEIFGKTRAEFLFFCCQKAKSKAGILRFRHFLCLPVILHRWFWFRAEKPHPLEGMEPGERAQASHSHAKVYCAAGEETESREKSLRKPPIRVQKANRPVTLQGWNPHFPLDYVVWGILTRTLHCPASHSGMTLKGRSILSSEETRTEVLQNGATCYLQRVWDTTGDSK